MNSKLETALAREAVIVLVCLIVFFVSTFYMDTSVFLRRLNFISIYFYPLYWFSRLCIWLIKYLMTYLKSSSYKTGGKEGKTQFTFSVNLEELFAREAFVILVFLVVLFVSAFYRDTAGIFEKLYFFSTRGYPVYLLIRLSIWGIKGFLLKK